jgi:hypothetical protein
MSALGIACAQEQLDCARQLHSCMCGLFAALQDGCVAYACLCEILHVECVQRRRVNDKDW